MQVLVPLQNVRGSYSRLRAVLQELMNRFYSSTAYGLRCGKTGGGAIIAKGITEATSMFKRQIHSQMQVNGMVLPLRRNGWDLVDFVLSFPGRWFLVSTWNLSYDLSRGSACLQGSPGKCEASPVGLLEGIEWYLWNLCGNLWPQMTQTVSVIYFHCRKFRLWVLSAQSRIWTQEFSARPVPHLMEPMQTPQISMQS